MIVTGVYVCFPPVCSVCGEVFSNLALVYSALVLFAQKSEGLDVKVGHMIIFLSFFKTTISQRHQLHGYLATV